MESADQKVWVKYGKGQPVKVSVPSDGDVSDLIEVIKGKLELTERLFEIFLHGPKQDRKEGGEHKDGEEETDYDPGLSVSTVLGQGVGVDSKHPMLIRTTAPPGIRN
jgi:hypothetical protein